MRPMNILSKSPFASTYFSWISYLFLPFILLLTLRNGINFWGYDHYALAWAKEWPRPISQYFTLEQNGEFKSFSGLIDMLQRIKQEPS